MKMKSIKEKNYKSDAFLYEKLIPTILRLLNQFSIESKDIIPFLKLATELKI